MQKPSERYKLTSDNNIITFKKPVHDPFNAKRGLREQPSIYYCWKTTFPKNDLIFVCDGIL